MTHSEPHQVDLEEYIAEKSGAWTKPERTGLQHDGSRDYEPLKRVLKLAYSQAAAGKGKERHANSKPFSDQPIMEIGRMVGMGYHTGQAIKKAQESHGMVARKQFPQAQAELLGAINYLASAWLLIEEMGAADTGKSG